MRCAMIECDPGIARLRAAGREAAADAAGFVEKRCLQPGIAQPPRTGEPGNAGSNDRDPHQTLVSRSPRWHARWPAAAGEPARAVDMRGVMRNFFRFVAFVIVAGLHEQGEVSQHVPWGIQG